MVPKHIALRRPDLFPDAGFFRGLGDSDLLLLVDTLPHRRRTRFTRATLPSGDRLSAPVAGRGRLQDLRFPVDPRWRRKFVRALDHAYPRTPDHQSLREDVFDIVQDAASPVDLNTALIRLHLRALRIRTPVARVSEVCAARGTGPEASLAAALDTLAPSSVALASNSSPPRELVDWAKRTGANIIVVPDDPEPVLAYTLIVEGGKDAQANLTR